MKIHEGDYVLGIWVLEEKDHKGNWMLSVFKEKNCDDWIIEQRFRLYVDDDLSSNSKDRKLFDRYRIKGNTPEAILIEVMESVRNELIAEGYGYKKETHVIRGGPEQLIESLKGSAMFHSEVRED